MRVAAVRGCALQRLLCAPHQLCAAGPSVALRGNRASLLPQVACRSATLDAEALTSLHLKLLATQPLAPPQPSPECAENDAVIQHIESVLGPLETKPLVRSGAGESRVAPACVCGWGIGHRQGKEGLAYAAHPTQRSPATALSPVMHGVPQAPPANPVVIVISGPSGVGKDAVLLRLKDLRPDLYFVVTATSRCALFAAACQA